VFDFAIHDFLDFFFDADVPMDVRAADAGVGMEMAVRWVPALLATVDTSTNAKPTAHPYSSICVVLPTALVLFYQEGAAGLLYAYSLDGGVTWSAPAVVSSRTDVYASAIVDPLTRDIHVVYSRWGDPALGDDVWYRTLTYTGAGVPWTVSAEISVSFASPAVGYRNAVVSAANDGKLQVLALRATTTTRDWAHFTAQAAWTLQNATETPNVLPASGSDKVSMLQLGAYTLALTRAGGSLILYRASGVDWGAVDVVYAVLDQWMADEEEGFSLAGDDFHNDDLGACYIYNTYPYFRKYSIDGTLLSGPTQIGALTNTESVDITWSGLYYQMAWIRNAGAGTRHIYWATEENWGILFLLTSNTGENWDWINLPASSMAGPALMIAWCETGLGGGSNNVYVGILPLHVDRIAADTGAGADALALRLMPTDTGAGADAVLITLPLTEPGAGADTLLLVLPLTDDAVGTEIYEKIFGIEETGIGEEETPDVAQALLDYAYGLEPDVVPVVAPIDDVTGFPFDSGHGVDIIPVPVVVGILDLGAGDDELLLVLAPAIAEAGSGLDTYGLLLALSDTGAGVDATIVGISLADMGSAAEVINFPVKQALEAGGGADALALVINALETGSGADAYYLLLLLTETGVGVDAASKSVAALVLAALRLLVSGGKLRLRVGGPGG